MAEQEYIVERPNTVGRIKDGINDHLRDTIFDDFGYGQGKKPYNLPYEGERKSAYNRGRSKPSRRLNAQGQDYATRDKEHMGRNPDGSKRIIPKNKSSMVRPS